MKNILIIGGSSGIGKQLALQLAEKGNEVFATYNKTIPTETHSHIHFTQFDVTQSALDISFLPEHLDGFVYCPGSILLKPFARIKSEEFLNDYQLNVLGAIQTLQSVLPLLKKSPAASILFFSTVAVQLGLNFHTQVATSKGALEGLTRALAAELAPNIRVNCIAPSLTDTPLSGQLLSTDEKREANAQRHPLKKIGTAQTIANMAQFLLGSESEWITGQIMHVDGGMSTLKI